MNLEGNSKQNAQSQLSSSGEQKEKYGYKTPQANLSELLHQKMQQLQSRRDKDKAQQEQVD